MSCVVLLVACVPVLAQPAPKPEASLGPALREISGWGLHLTGQALDLLSDPRIFWVLDSDELALRIRAAVMAADEIDKQLAKVATIKGLPKDDADGLARLRKVAGLLKQQGESLQTFWDSGVIDHLKESEVAGKKARKEIDAMLDLNPKSGIAPLPREPKKKP
jgi:hypothetical protein